MRETLAMRLIVFTTFAACAAMPALASSIEVISGARTGNGSMVSITCKSCPPPAPRQQAIRQTSTLGEAVQKEEIREVNGERVIMRTDRWMGGSPSVFYQKLTPAREAAILGKPAAGPETTPIAADVNAPDGIDASATTAAVSGAATGMAVDFSAYQLRLN